MVIQTNTPLRRSFRIRSRSIIKRRTSITKDSTSTATVHNLSRPIATTSPLRRPSLQLEQNNNNMDFDPPSSPRPGRAAQQGQQYVRRRSSSSRRASGDSQTQRRRSTVDSLPMSIDSPSTSARQILSRNVSSISSSSGGRQRSDPLFRPPIEPLDSQQQQLRSASEHTIRSSSSPNNAPSSNSSLQTTDTSGGGGGGPIRRTSMSDLEQASCRTQIKEIMKDGRLSQLEKRRSIQYLMDGRRRSTMDGTNPYLQAKAAAAAKEHRESIRRSSSFDNETTDGTTNGNAEPESADSLRESLRNSFRSQEGPLDMSTTDEFAYGGGGIDNDDDEEEDDCLDMSVSMGDNNNNTPAAAAVAAWRAFHGENNNQKEDPDELIEVPNHDPQAAAAIARAHQDTTTEYYTAKHPYNATCTKVPAVAAQDPKMNNKKMKDKLRTMQLNKRAIETAPPCTHYERNCHIVSPCCGATFGCRICHDDCPILPPMLVNKPDMMEMGGGDSKEKGIPRRATLPSSFEASLAPPRTRAS